MSWVAECCSFPGKFSVQFSSLKSPPRFPRIAICKLFFGFAEKKQAESFPFCMPTWHDITPWNHLDKLPSLQNRNLFWNRVWYCCEHLDVKIKVFCHVTLRRNIRKHLNLQHHLCENPKFLKEDYQLAYFKRRSNIKGSLRIACCRFV
jgi:hypothetical protein